LQEEDFDVSNEEDPELRRLVDEKLESILIDNQFDLFSDLLIIEPLGSTSERLQALEAVLR